MTEILESYYALLKSTIRIQALFRGRKARKFCEKFDSEYSTKKGGKTILQIAIENGQTEMVKLILDFLSEDVLFDMLNEPNFGEPY